jgi:hypothetical protein
VAKEVLKITNWVGGLNCATDPRDIDDTQFAQLWNLIDDVGGVLRKVGGAEDSIINLDHDNTNQQTGTGLFTMQTDYSFSSFNGTFNDGYEKGTTVLYNDLHANAILDNTGDFSANWAETGDFAIDSTDATYTHSTGAGTLYQTAAQFANAAANDTMYKLTFTISSVVTNYNITSITLKGGTGYIAAEDISLFPDSNPNNNTYTRYFLSAANVSSDKFQLDVASGGACSFNLDDVSLVKTSAIQLASTPSYIDSSLYDNQDHFQNMTLLIYSGTGVGQSRIILGYNGVQKVAGLDANFVTDPSAAGTSKYMIFNWYSSGFGNDGDNDLITDNTGDGDWPDTEGNFLGDASTHHLITKQTSITDTESSDLGYIELKGSGEITGNDTADPQFKSLTIKPGILYNLSFYAKSSKKYNGYVADTTHCERPPFVTLHSTTTTDGTDTGMYLFSNNTWLSDADSVDNVTKPHIVKGDFESSSISSNAPTSFVRIGSDVTCTLLGSGQYGSDGQTLNMEAGGSFVQGGVEIITDEDNRLMTTSTTPDWAEFDEGGTMGAGDHSLLGNILTITGNSGTTTDEGTQLAVAKMTTLIVGRSYKVSASIYSTSGNIAGVKIGLGGALSNAFTITEDTTPIEKVLRVTDASGTLRIYFETDSTVPWVIDNVSVKSIDPNSFIYQEVELEDNQYYNLNFVHSSNVGGLTYAIYDEESKLYIKDWSAVQSTGALTTYKFLNQSIDNLALGGFTSTAYERFYIPANSGSTRSIRFMFSCSETSTHCRLDGITAFKAWNDLTTMSNNSNGANPYSNGVKDWNKYSMTFKLPYSFSETSDWVLRLYAGLAAYQASATDGTTADTDSHTIEFDNIRLESQEIDNLTFLADNSDTFSKIKIYSGNSSIWDSDFLAWTGLRSQPVFTKIYDSLKICDANFNNNNNSLILHYNDRKILQKYPLSGYEVFQSGLCTNPTLKIITGADSEIYNTVMNGITYINTTNNGLHYATTNWDADKIDGDPGIVIRYLRGSDLDDDNLDNHQDGGELLDSSDNTSPYTQLTSRGLRYFPNDRNIIHLWIQGDDGSANDMASILSSGGDIAKVEYSFTHKIHPMRRWKGNGGQIYDYAAPTVKVECGKVDESLLSGGTTAATLQPVIDGESIANNFDNLSGGGPHFYGQDDSDYGISLGESYAGQSIGDSTDTWEVFNNYLGQSTMQCHLEKTISGEFIFEVGEITKSNDIMFKIVVGYPVFSGGSWLDFFDYNTSGIGNDAADDTALFKSAKHERIVFNTLNIYAYDNNYTTAADSITLSSGNEILINWKFGTPTDSDGSFWGGHKYKVGVTSVNIFGEENHISEGDFLVGADADGTSNVTAGQAPTVNVYMSNTVLRDAYKKETKIYLKDNETDIWYLQFRIDHDTGKLHTLSSGYKATASTHASDNMTSWQVQKDDMLSPNLVDTYESETFLETAYTDENRANMTCRYKTAVILNDRLYAGNILQNGKIYSDRMIVSPREKYNILPHTQAINVAINDGDEITALSYYKDKLLQFKKHKVFIINTSGDYEFLEETLENIGVNLQCQITKTPYGIVWANKQGCFLYNGEQVANLIDKKIAPTSDTSFASNNYWRLGTFTPVIGYIEEKKALIILNDKDNWALASGPEGYEYNFLTESWSFLQYRTPDSGSFISGNGNKSNMAIDKDGNLIWHVAGTSTLNKIIKWNDAARNFNDTVASDDSAVTFTSKDYDFGFPGVRKKIYKVYITYKSTDPAGSAADSKILVKYNTNGTLTSFVSFPAGTNYHVSNGLEGSTEWKTAILKPSSAINNVYSFQLQFTGTADIPSGFKINDFSIVYRMKPVK